MVIARADQRPLIEGLLRFYLYDFSEMEPVGSDDLELDESGGFGPYPDLGGYWSGPDRVPLLIRVANHPAGFALLNTLSHRGGRVQRNMAEFFIGRKHRRQGVAREAVRQILSLYPGRWEVAVVARNAAAQAFWPRAIGAAPNVTSLLRVEGDGARWRGPIWTFLASPTTSGG